MQHTIYQSNKWAAGRPERARSLKEFFRRTRKSFSSTQAPEQAQIPDDLRPGLYVAQVRSLANATQSDPVLITVQRPQ